MCYYHVILDDYEMSYNNYIRTLHVTVSVCVCGLGHAALIAHAWVSRSTGR